MRTMKEIFEDLMIKNAIVFKKHKINGELTDKDMELIRELSQTETALIMALGK